MAGLLCVPRGTDAQSLLLIIRYLVLRLSSSGSTNTPLIHSSDNPHKVSPHLRRARHPCFLQHLSTSVFVRRSEPPQALSLPRASQLIGMPCPQYARDPTYVRLSCDIRALAFIRFRFCITMTNTSFGICEHPFCVSIWHLIRNPSFPPCARFLSRYMVATNFTTRVWWCEFKDKTFQRFSLSRSLSALCMCSSFIFAVSLPQFVFGSGMHLALTHSAICTLCNYITSIWEVSSTLCINERE